MSNHIDDPQWPRASSLLREPTADADTSLIGLPVHLSSLTPGRCDLAPAALRAALGRLSTFDLEHNLDLSTFSVADHGDLDVAQLLPAEAFVPIIAALKQIRRDASQVIVAVGGDNCVTRPLVHGVGCPLTEIGLITLDAHFDLRSTAAGLSNGNPISALLDDGLPGSNIVQIGLQPFANSHAYARYAQQHGLTTVTARQARRRGIAAVIHDALCTLTHARVIAVDFDLDVLDRVWMPAAPGSRPGGFTPDELFEAAFLLGSEARVVTADFVECDPRRDVAEVSVLTAAACLLSFLSGVKQRHLMQSAR